ncbi:putative transporter [Smittium mucronatum]|uniref:Putative transporter n=1 Tax=Smittium mucronatum TaxID=133383 RepID=A0A1R0GX88_9FUNG|nr:putative transporter [Smittium mucronatum]
MFLLYLYLASKAIAEIFLIAVCGYYFARRGTLNKRSLRMMSELSVQLLTPCLLFSNMVETLNPTVLLELWLTPVAYFFYGFVSFVWVYASGYSLNVKSDYLRLLSVAVFFANTNTIPVSLMKNILSSPGSEFLYKDPNDTPKLMAARGVSYSIMFATFANLLRWSLGTMMISGGKKIAKKRTIKSSFHSMVPTPSTSPYLSGGIPVIVKNDSVRTGMPDLLLPSSSFYKKSPHNSSLGISDSSSAGATLPSGMPSVPDNSNHDISFSHESEQFEESSYLEYFASNAKHYFYETISVISACLSMPVYAIILAVICVSIPPIKKGLLEPNSGLNIIYGAIDMCGDACVPLIILTLGGQIGQMGLKKNNNDDDEDTSKPSLYSKLKSFIFSRFSSESTLPSIDPTREPLLSSKDEVNSNGFQPPKFLVTSSSDLSIKIDSNLTLSNSAILEHPKGKSSDTKQKNLNNNPSNSANSPSFDVNNAMDMSSSQPGTLSNSGSHSPISSRQPGHKELSNSGSSESMSSLKVHDKKNLKSSLKHPSSSYHSLNLHNDVEFTSSLQSQLSNGKHPDSLSPSPPYDPSNSSQFKKTSFVDFEHELNSRMQNMHDSDSESEVLYSNHDKNKGIAIVLLGRFLVVPTAAILFLICLRSLFPNQVLLLVNDPVFFFTLLVLSATPPAINLITVVQSVGLFEDDAANLLMWSYLVGTVTISFEVGFFMYLTNFVFNH